MPLRKREEVQALLWEVAALIAPQSRRWIESLITARLMRAMSKRNEGMFSRATDMTTNMAAPAFGRS